MTSALMESLRFIRDFGVFTMTVIADDATLLPLSTQLQRWNIEYKAKTICPRRTFYGDSKSTRRFGHTSIDHV